MAAQEELQSYYRTVSSPVFQTIVALEVILIFILLIILIKQYVEDIEDVLYIKKIKQFIKMKFIHRDNQGGNDEDRKEESN